MSKYFRPWNIDQTLFLPPSVAGGLCAEKAHCLAVFYYVELVRERALDLKEDSTGSLCERGFGQAAHLEPAG